MAETKKAPNQIVRLALVLFLVSAIVSGVLGFVNMLTKDRIKELEEQARAEAYNAVLPWDGEYTDVAYDKEAFQTVDAVAPAGDEGWVVERTVSGAPRSNSPPGGMAVTKDGGTVDSITAATISARAMANAANTAIAVVKSLG